MTTEEQFQQFLYQTMPGSITATMDDNSRNALYSAFSSLPEEKRQSGNYTAEDRYSAIVPLYPELEPYIMNDIVKKQLLDSGVEGKIAKDAARQYSNTPMDARTDISPFLANATKTYNLDRYGNENGPSNTGGVTGLMGDIAGNINPGKFLDIANKVEPYLKAYNKIGMSLAMTALGGPVFGGAVGGMYGSAIDGNNFGDVLTSGAKGAGMGVVAGSVTGMMSPVTDYLTSAGLSTAAAQGVTNTLAATGTNAIKQYATTGSIDPTQLAVSAIPSVVNGAVNYAGSTLGDTSFEFDDYPSQAMIDAGTANPTVFQDFASYEPGLMEFDDYPNQTMIDSGTAYTPPTSAGELDLTYDDYPSQAMIDQGVANPTALQNYTFPAAVVKPTDYGKLAQTAAKLFLQFGNKPKTGNVSYSNGMLSQQSDDPTGQFTDTDPAIKGVYKPGMTYEELLAIGNSPAPISQAIKTDVNDWQQAEKVKRDEGDFSLNWNNYA